MPDSDYLLGGLAALLTALFWALSTTIWGAVGKKNVPALSLIVIRVTLATLLLCLINRATNGTFWPSDVGGEALLLLAVSGILAMNLGDFTFFKSVSRIGPRLLMVIFAASPIVTAIIAWLVMGEAISLRGLVGIVVIMGGIVWVVSEPRGEDGWTKDPKQFRLGVLLAVISCLATATAYAFTRAAVGGGPRLFGDGPPLTPVHPVEAAILRLAAAGAIAWMVLPFTSALRPTGATVTNPALLKFIIPGTLAGLFLGSWFSMMALARMPGGIASALMSCSPIFMIPLTRLFFGERHSARAMVGTGVTVAGVFVLLA